MLAVLIPKQNISDQNFPERERNRRSQLCENKSAGGNVSECFCCRRQCARLDRLITIQHSRVYKCKVNKISKQGVEADKLSFSNADDCYTDGSSLPRTHIMHTLLNREGYLKKMTQKRA